MPASLPAIRRAAIVEIVRQLRLAREAIAELLAHATSADAARRLRRQQAEIERVLRSFGEQVVAAADAAATSAQALARERAGLGQPGLAARLNPRALLATRLMLTDRIADVTARAQRQIHTALTQHLLGVRSLSQTISDIQTLLDGAPRRRAMTIAYTEISRVYNAAYHESLLERARRTPGLKKRWVHSRKEHGRPGHIHASQQDPIPVAESFLILDVKTGTTEALRYPCDPDASAGNTINCGCMLEAVELSLEDMARQPLVGRKPDTVIINGEYVKNGVRTGIYVDGAGPGAAGTAPPAAAAPPVAVPAAPGAVRAVQDAGGMLPPMGPPGGGRGPPDGAVGAPVAAALGALEGRVAQAGGRRVLARLWTDLDSYAEHVARRIRAGHVVDAVMLADRTFEVLAATRGIQVALDPTGRRSSLKFQVTPTGWIVIVDGQGRIVTSYQFNPALPGFVQWNTDKGFAVHDHALTPTDREMLARLFGRH